MPFLHICSARMPDISYCFLYVTSFWGLTSVIGGICYWQLRQDVWQHWCWTCGMCEPSEQETTTTTSYDTLWILFPNVRRISTLLCIFWNNAVKGIITPVTGLHEWRVVSTKQLTRDTIPKRFDSQSSEFGQHSLASPLKEALAPQAALVYRTHQRRQIREAYCAGLQAWTWLVWNALGAECN